MLVDGALVNVTVDQDGKDITLTGNVPYSSGNVNFSSIVEEQAGNYVSLVAKINGEISDNATLKMSANPRTFKVKDVLDTGKTDEITMVLRVTGGTATATFDWDGNGPEEAVTYSIDTTGLTLEAAPTQSPS